MKRGDALVNQVYPVNPTQQGGYVIVTVLVITLITGILLSGTIHTTHDIEQTAGHSIQYSRAMEAAEGGGTIALKNLIRNSGVRLFADTTATDGVFSLDSVNDKWWADSAYAGQHELDAGIVTGVAETPRYVYEQIGAYIADGGSGVVNLDIGGASYGRTSSGAREYVLYKVQAQGVGSRSNVQRAIETVVIVTK